jgi:hypothetical protein
MNTSPSWSTTPDVHPALLGDARDGVGEQAAEEAACRDAE